jgi:ribosomal protein S8
MSEHKDINDVITAINNGEDVTPTELANAAGVRPQVMYNLARQGYLVIEEREVTITKKMVPNSAAVRYLKRRAERLANRES